MRAWAIGYRAIRPSSPASWPRMARSSRGCTPCRVVAPHRVRGFRSAVRRYAGGPPCDASASTDPRRWPCRYFRLSTVRQPFDLLDQWLRRRLRKILWEQWRKPKTRYRKLVALGVKAERARWATATGRGAWWNAGASHMHAAITSRLLTQWGLLSLFYQIPVRSRLF